MATTVLVAGVLSKMGMNAKSAFGGAVLIEVLSTIGMISMAHTSYNKATVAEISTVDRTHVWLVCVFVMCLIVIRGKVKSL